MLLVKGSPLSGLGILSKPVQKLWVWRVSSLVIRQGRQRCLARTNGALSVICNLLEETVEARFFYGKAK